MLRDAGFDVVPAATARGGARRAPRCSAPDAAIVDLVLPDCDGVEVPGGCASGRDAPIIVLSAVGEEEEKVRALEAGADDYVTKPFGPRELVARLRGRAAPRRRAARRAGRSAPSGLELDLAAHVARRGGEVVHLTPIEFELLQGR